MQSENSKKRKIGSDEISHEVTHSYKKKMASESNSIEYDEQDSENDNPIDILTRSSNSSEMKMDCVLCLSIMTRKQDENILEMQEVHERFLEKYNQVETQAQEMTNNFRYSIEKCNDFDEL